MNLRQIVQDAVADAIRNMLGEPSQPTAPVTLPAATGSTEPYVTPKADRRQGGTRGARTWNGQRKLYRPVTVEQRVQVRRKKGQRGPNRYTTKQVMVVEHNPALIESLQKMAAGYRPTLATVMEHFAKTGSGISMPEVVAATGQKPKQIESALHTLRVMGAIESYYPDAK